MKERMKIYTKREKKKDKMNLIWRKLKNKKKMKKN